MQSEKCSSCGANIVTSKSENKYVCPYCDTVYAVNKSETKVQPTINTQISIPQKQNIPKRPKVNVFLLLFLFYCGFFPAIFYLGYVVYKQHKWDDTYCKD